MTDQRFTVGQRVQMPLKLTGEILRGTVLELDELGCARIQFDCMADETWQALSSVSQAGTLSPSLVEAMREIPGFGSFS